MLFQKNKVEEDLERIRNANLTSEQIEAYNKRIISKKQFFNKSKANNFNYVIDNNYINENEHHEQKEKLELERNDILAMILAVFSIILPYILAFIAIMCFAIMLIHYLF